MCNQINTVRFDSGDRNQLIAEGNDGSGVVFTVYDPTGECGAENLLNDLTEGQVLDLPCQRSKIIQQVSQLAEFSHGHFEVMNIAVVSNLRFALDYGSHKWDS